MSTHSHYIFLMKSTTLQIRLSEDEKLAFERASENAGIALSAWVRERLRTAARRELTDSGEQIPFLRPRLGAHDARR
jgi:hypothetical protein